MIAFFLRHLADSNRCTRFCRPLPSHSAKMPLIVNGWQIYIYFTLTQEKNIQSVNFVESLCPVLFYLYCNGFNITAYRGVYLRYAQQYPGYRWYFVKYPAYYAVCHMFQQFGAYGHFFHDNLIQVHIIYCIGQLIRLH
jgi:hypothetical protein